MTCRNNLIAKATRPASYWENSQHKHRVHTHIHTRTPHAHTRYGYTRFVVGLRGLPFPTHLPAHLPAFPAHSCVATVTRLRFAVAHVRFAGSRFTRGYAAFTHLFYALLVCLLPAHTVIGSAITPYMAR